MFNFVNPKATRTIGDNHVNSIALTPRTRRSTGNSEKASRRFLIYAPLTSLEFFYVDTDEVKAKKSNISEGSFHKLTGGRAYSIVDAQKVTQKLRTSLKKSHVANRTKLRETGWLQIRKPPLTAWPWTLKVDSTSQG